MTGNSRRLLWIGDAVAASGFAKATHGVLESLKETWDVHVLGINYHGDPHKYSYPIYPCVSGGDALGYNRTDELVSRLRPDVVVLLNDPWNVPRYLRRISDERSRTPTVGWIAVDGKNCRGTDLNGLSHAIFWTEFARSEAARGGYRGGSSVVPLGVDIGAFAPMPRDEARRMVGLPASVKDAFIFGNLNRNQPRKRLDLTIRAFYEFVRGYDIRDAYLYLHVAPTGDMGVDASQLMAYYGLSNRLIIAQPPLFRGSSLEILRATYCAFDVQITTTLGEGWGLPTMEGMACGIPQIVPEWSALAEWTEGRVLGVPCSSTESAMGGSNNIGGVVDMTAMVEAMHLMYSEADVREKYSAEGYELVTQSRFRWSEIGAVFGRVLDGILEPRLASVS